MVKTVLNVITLKEIQRTMLVVFDNKGDSILSTIRM